jgi:DNA-binding PadR family transcriptional regulator
MFYILLALMGRESHGYAIMQEIESQTSGSVRLAPGTLYRSIKHLLEAGLIDESGDRPDPKMDDERRRYYRITGAGERAASDEAARLAELVRYAQRKKILKPDSQSRLRSTP